MVVSILPALPLGYHSDQNCTATYTRLRLPTCHGARYLPVGCHHNPNCTATLNRHRLCTHKLQVVKIQLQMLYHMIPHDLHTHVCKQPTQAARAMTSPRLSGVNLPSQVFCLISPTGKLDSEQHLKAPPLSMLTYFSQYPFR